MPVSNKHFESPHRRIFLSLTMLLTILSLSCQQQRQATPAAQPTPANKTFNGPPGFPAPVMNQPYPGTGVVVQINRKEGWIEINHEEIKGLMPAMQMEFWVKSRSLLDGVKAGDRVDFTVVETEKGEYLTELRKAAKPYSP
jgi:Cu/Ag efflux protein CusF